MRLIDTDALPNYKFNATVEVGEHKGPAELRVAFWEDIKKAPTIDAVPVVHARWALIEGFWCCSTCGCSPADWEPKPDNPYGLPPYCH